MKINRRQLFESFAAAIAGLYWWKRPTLDAAQPFRLNGTQRMILLKSRQCGMTHFSGEIARLVVRSRQAKKSHAQTLGARR